MDRGFPAVPLWKAYTNAGAHLLIRARSSVARRPIEVLADATHLALTSLGGQRASPPARNPTRPQATRLDRSA